MPLEVLLILLIVVVHNILIHLPLLPTNQNLPRVLDPQVLVRQVLQPPPIPLHERPHGLLLSHLRRLQRGSEQVHGVQLKRRVLKLTLSPLPHGKLELDEPEERLREHHSGNQLALEQPPHVEHGAERGGRGLDIRLRG